MKIKILFILLTFYVGYSQNDSIPVSRDYVYHSDEYTDYIRIISFRIGAGVLIPQDNLKKYFDVSPFLELSFNLPLKNRKSLELAIQFVIPNQKNDFQYHRTIDTVRAKASFMFNPMVRFKKSLIKSDKSKLSIGLGVGASIISTDARNPFYEGKDDENKYEMITALLISPCIDYTFKFRNNDEISLGFSLHYSPYKIEGALRENIGGIFYVPKISYRF